MAPLPSLATAVNTRSTSSSVVTSATRNCRPNAAAACSSLVCDSASTGGRRGNHLVQQLESFRRELRLEIALAGDVSAGMAEARYHVTAV